jgi:UDPglucose 6-dehydrogenase
MIGSGYVGLVSGACFADFGHHVTCVDKDGAKIARLRDGDIPIFEPDLDRLVSANMREGRLDFTTDLPGPVAEAEAVFIAVGTPSRRGDGHADLSYVEWPRARSRPRFRVSRSRSNGSWPRPGPTPTWWRCPIRSSCAKARRSRDFKHPDRIVVGTADERAKKVMAELCRPLYLNQARRSSTPPDAPPN